MTSAGPTRAAIAGAALAACLSCNLWSGGEVEPTASERYARALVDLGMAHSAIARAWSTARDNALVQPAEQAVPFHEVVYLDPGEPSAVGYRVALRRGQQLLVDVTMEEPAGGQVFVDVLPLAPLGSAGSSAEAKAELRPIAGGTCEQPFTFEAPRNGDFVIRIQPELLVGGRVTIVLEPGPSLAFPVLNRGNGAIASVFGDPREGGKRLHEGMDITAPRGTPAVAPADAYVVRVGFDRLGGKIVWLRDPARELRYYYAHLDQQLVTTGDFVPSGGTVGLVGNTGNAITSKPHLHFGIYDGDAIDPVPFVELPRFRAVEVSADIELIGEWARVSDRSTRLRKGPTASSDVERTLDRETTVRVIGAIDHWYRVCLPDGASGYLGARSIERLGKPIEAIAVAQAGVLRRRPDPTAPAIAAVDAAAQLSVLGRFGPYLYVSSPDHRPGWLLIP